MESLLLKVLDFELQRPTGPSSGVVASILLVSPGVSLAEVCATCQRCPLWSAPTNLVLHFMNLKKNLCGNGTHLSHIQLIFFYIIRMPISYSKVLIE